ncbi:MAG: hypothetical protein HW413_2417, partial [Thermoleophilia bacterium]|nr:hypothetical protein [Thermoleophilia bacterium]
MPGEDHERHVTPLLGNEEESLVAGALDSEPGGDQRQDVLSNRVLVPTDGRDVDQLERPRGKAIG